MKFISSTSLSSFSLCPFFGAWRIHPCTPSIFLAIFTTGELIGRLFTDRIELHLKRVLLPKKAARKVFLNGIEQPGGRELVTLEDAGTQITKLPKAVSTSD